MENSTKPSLDRRVVEALESTIPHYARSVRAVLDDIEQPDLITLAQLRTLQAIAAYSESGTLNTTLARQLGVAAPSMTAMVDGLVERGLVDRTIDPNNRRQVIIRLTENGISRLATLESAITERISTALAVLSQDQKEHLLGALHDLERMLAAMPDGSGRPNEG
jgi:DNA-binding MarR family transcriptional regulator